jgi:hypothetical protein
MGMRMPETCWAVFKWRAINLRDWCIWLVDLFECMMMHGITNPKFNKAFFTFKMPHVFKLNDVSFKPIRERRLPCADIRHTHVFSSITCASPILNFAQIGQKMWKVRTAINRRPEVKYGWQRADLLRNSSSPSDSLYTSPASNLIHVGWKKYIYVSYYE